MVISRKVASPSVRPKILSAAKPLFFCSWRLPLFRFDQLELRFERIALGHQHLHVVGARRIEELVRNGDRLAKGVHLHCFQIIAFFRVADFRQLVGYLDVGKELQVMMGNKIIEVRNLDADKGTAIEKVLQREKQDFILAIGDDRTDEDMFRILVDREKAFTIKVGPEASFARFNLHTPQMVISLLGNLTYMEQQSAK